MARQISDIDIWTTKRPHLNNSYNINGDWVEVIGLFKNRINDFYFAPINKIAKPLNLKGEGFTILTVQCALIEMFAAFKYGKIHKHDKRNNDPSYLYKNSNECFIPFLHSEAIFQNHFHTIENGVTTTNHPYSANIFYDQVRCGLMHEARTKGKWFINAKRKYNGDETIFITQTANKISIDRSILNERLMIYFQDYLIRLSQNSEEGNRARRLFARKLDHLYDIPQDPNFEWWNEH